MELHVHFDGAFDTSLVFAEAKALQARGELIGLPEEVDIFGETLRVRDAVMTPVHVLTNLKKNAHRRVGV